MLRYSKRGDTVFFLSLPGFQHLFFFFADPQRLSDFLNCFVMCPVIETVFFQQFLDACFDAKRLIEKLPDLPDGMKPRQVHVLDAVNEIQKKQGFCRVSDISSYMNTTLPSITKLVQELEERNLLVKQADEKDKRVINLTLTEEGKEFVELRVTHFHGEWASRLPDLDDAVVDEFVHAITRMQETMPGIKGVKNNGKRK